jgi:hypothetical protein
MPVSLASSSAAAMHGAIVPIAYGTPNGTSNYIQFNNIPQTYQDLMIVSSLRSDRSATLENFNVGIPTINNIYSFTKLIGNGSSATSTRNSGLAQYFCYLGSVPAATSTSGIYGSSTTHILNYKNTSTYKTVLARTAADLNGSGETVLGVGTMQTLTAITTLFVATEFTNMTGTVALYGIRSVGQ